MTKNPGTSVILIVSMLLAACGGGDTPSPNTTTWTVTPGGGSYQTADGGVTLEVPPAAVTRDTLITPQPLASPDAPPQNHAPVGGTLVQFNSVTFNTPVTLRFRIPASVADADVPFVRIFRKPDGAGPWQALATTVDAAARVASAQVSGFSGFGLFASTLGANEWEIGPPGGEFNGAANRLGLTVSAGAIRALYRVRHTPIAASDLGQSPAGWQYVENSAYDFVWSDVTTSFDPAATFRLRFDGLTLPCDPSLVAIFTRTDFGDAHTWNQDATGVDAAAGEATVLVNKLRQHALFCPLPAPVHRVVIEEYNNGGPDYGTTLKVQALEQGAFVDVSTQTFVRNRDSSGNFIVDSDTFRSSGGGSGSGCQVSPETLTASATILNNKDTLHVVAYNLASGALESIDAESFPASNPTTPEYGSAGISRDGRVIVATRPYQIQGYAKTGLRVFSTDSKAMLREVSHIGNNAGHNAWLLQGVGPNGEVVMKGHRGTGQDGQVALVKSDGSQQFFSGTLPRLGPAAKKLYVINAGGIEEYDLTSGQLRSIPISPVDYAIQTGALVYYKAVAGGCQVIRRDLQTGRETELAALTACTGTTVNGTSVSTVYMVQ